MCWRVAEHHGLLRCCTWGLLVRGQTQPEHHRDPPFVIFVQSFADFVHPTAASKPGSFVPKGGMGPMAARGPDAPRCAQMGLTCPESSPGAGSALRRLVHQVMLDPNPSGRGLGWPWRPWNVALGPWSHIGPRWSMGPRLIGWSQRPASMPSMRGQCHHQWLLGRWQIWQIMTDMTDADSENVWYCELCSERSAQRNRRLGSET